MTNKRAEPFEGLAMTSDNICFLKEATVSISDRGFLFGESVFETLLFFGNELVDLESHLKRLCRGCARIGIEGFSPEKARADLQKVALEYQKQTAEPARVRIIVTGGSSLHLSDFSQPYKTYILFTPQLGTPVASSRVRLMTVPDPRLSKFVETKISFYLPSILALKQVRKSGYDDALYLNKKQEITEATTANFIWKNREGILATAPAENNCLPGTTLRLVCNQLQKEGDPIKVEALSKEQLTQDCVAAALVSSVAGVRSVVKIDNHTFCQEESEKLLLRLKKLLFESQNS